MIHPIAKSMGYKSDQDFYKDFDTQEKYENYMRKGGQINVNQNQALPEDRSVDSKLRNVQETKSSGNKRSEQIPFPIQAGAYTDTPQTMKKGGEYSGTYDGGTGSYYKDGGIQIKSENKGKFTEYKKRTGKTTEEALHSKDPHVRQMANFARNAKKWKHEEGGEVIPHKFQYGPGGYMQQGGDPEQEMERPDAQPTTPKQSNGDPIGVVPNQPDAAWRQGMTDQQANDTLQTGTDNHQNNLNSNSNQMQSKNNNFGKAVGFGAGLFTDLALINNRNTALRNQAGSQMSHGMTSSQYPAINPLGVKGDYGMVGQGYGQNLNNFSYANTGNFKQPIMKQGGMPTYEVGGVYEMSTAEIDYLKKLGYQIQHM